MSARLTQPVMVNLRFSRVFFCISVFLHLFILIVVCTTPIAWGVRVGALLFWGLAVHGQWFFFKRMRTIQFVRINNEQIVMGVSGEHLLVERIDGAVETQFVIVLSCRMRKNNGLLPEQFHLPIFLDATSKESLRGLRRYLRCR